jgi:hypothetical protein
VAGLRGDADLGVLLEPTDPRAVPGARVDDEERALAVIDRIATCEVPEGD